VILVGRKKARWRVLTFSFSIRKRRILWIDLADNVDQSKKKTMTVTENQIPHRKIRRKIGTKSCPM
jgi:hypothetical protein